MKYKLREISNLSTFKVLNVTILVLFKNERMIYMKVAVLGATGKEGQLLLAEAKRRGMDVTAIVRNASKITDGTPTIEKDVYQLTTEDIQAFDVLISALGFPDVKISPNLPSI